MVNRHTEALSFLWRPYFTYGWLKPAEIIRFESRFYLFALEMWRHGISWFPTSYTIPIPIILLHPRY